jgi:hypothetical protein
MWILHLGCAVDVDILMNGMVSSCTVVIVHYCHRAFLWCGSGKRSAAAWDNYHTFIEVAKGSAKPKVMQHSSYVVAFMHFE